MTVKAFADKASNSRLHNAKLRRNFNDRENVTLMICMCILCEGCTPAVFLKAE